jgi:hypothetical protein
LSDFKKKLDNIVGFEGEGNGPMNGADITNEAKVAG